MRGLKRDRTARVILARHAFIQNARLLRPRDRGTPHFPPR
jgi:hypothetical protein